MRYRVQVIEVIDHPVEYTVEVDSPKEAAEKAENGETVDGLDCESVCNSVRDRVVQNEPEAVG